MQVFVQVQLSLRATTLSEQLPGLVWLSFCKGVCRRRPTLSVSANSSLGSGNGQTVVVSHSCAGFSTTHGETTAQTNSPLSLITSTMIGLFVNGLYGNFYFRVNAFLFSCGPFFNSSVSSSKDSQTLYLIQSDIGSVQFATETRKVVSTK